MSRHKRKPYKPTEAPFRMRDESDESWANRAQMAEDLATHLGFKNAKNMALRSDSVCMRLPRHLAAKGPAWCRRTMEAWHEQRPVWTPETPENMHHVSWKVYWPAFLAMEEVADKLNKAAGRNHWTPTAVLRGVLQRAYDEQKGMK